MKTGIRTYLLANATLKAALATINSVFSFPVPQDATMPYLVISSISATIQNLAASSLDIYDEIWQIDVYASTDSSAESIKELVIGVMNLADRVEMGSYTVYTSTLEGVADNTDIEMDGSEARIARKTLDFRLIRDRTVTT